jgi:hypothetical protein
MSNPAGVRSTVKALLLFVGAIALVGAILIALASAGVRQADTLKALLSCGIGVVCLLVVFWSIRTGYTGFRMLSFERKSSPIGFWLVLVLWTVIGAVVLAKSGQELQAGFTGHAPNNSFKPKPLRGSA